MQIQNQSIEEAGDPRGPLDFHTGNAELLVGDLVYAPAVEKVVRYFGEDLVKLTPGGPGEPGMISAVFTDDDGNAILELDENEWIGSLEAWDIEVEGQRITVRKREGLVALQLRLDPPGRVIVERLDMRIGVHHILASEQSYAVGVLFGTGQIGWVSPHVHITKAMPQGVAIELATDQTLRERFQYFKTIGQGKWLATDDERFVIHSPAGVMVPELGISVASWCSFNLYEHAVGIRALEDMREAVFHHSARAMRQFLGTGAFAPADPPA